MRVLSFPTSRPGEDPFGFAAASPSVGAAHRAALGRGLAFVLMLAATSLASVCVPALCDGPHWIEGTAAAVVSGR